LTTEDMVVESVAQNHFDFLIAPTMPQASPIN
jgi:hypothetical protein